MSALNLDVRPLDPVRSIKAKLGLLVAGSVIASAGLTWFFLQYLGWHARYALVVSVAASLVVTQVLAHGMTSPLRQMTAAASEMAAGRTPPPVRATSRDEVGDLARAFTSMSVDLASADAQRRELLANVAHELRTPVSALRAQLENLADGVRTPDAAALGEVLHTTERLAVLVDDLLDLARTEAGVRPLARSRVPVLALVTEVVREVSSARPGTPQRPVRVDVTVPADLAADADPARLRQVVVNLVDNAVRHARSRVQVRGRDDGSGGLVLDVEDDGPGIAAADRDLVFERFRRGTPATPAHGVPAARSDGGTGLGLSIARWAVVLHGGRIEVLPDTPGCLIRVALPAVPQEVQR